jgi:hypothetical protein
MTDYPDVYADGLTITVSPIGVVFTFTRTDPAIPNVSESEQVVAVSRIRLARPVAEAVRDLLTQSLSGQQGTQTVTH